MPGKVWKHDFMREAVLQIYYKDKYGKVHHEAQGKFYYREGKPVFLADMTPGKWWRNYGGYSIAKQILTAFSKAKVKPLIIYRLKEQNILYLTNSTTFQKKGILTPYGFHEQWVLPIKNFKATEGDIENEPHGLPSMDLAEWLKTAQIVVKKEVNLDEKVMIPYETKTKLGQLFREQLKERNIKVG